LRGDSLPENVSFLFLVATYPRAQMKFHTLIVPNVLVTRAKFHVNHDANDSPQPVEKADFLLLSNVNPVVPPQTRSQPHAVTFCSEILAHFSSFIRKLQHLAGVL